MAILWMLTRDAFADATWPEEDLCAFDDGVVFPRLYPRPEGECIGMVRLTGPSMWSWFMTVRLPGPTFGSPTNGYEETRDDAGRAMLECYERYLKSRPVDYTRS